MADPAITAAVVLRLMAAIHPQAPTTGSAQAFAHAIAWVAEHDSPPPSMTKLEGAAELAVYGWGEGRFQLAGKRGDLAISPVGAVCSFQIWARDEKQARQLEADPVACTRAAYFILREGAKHCDLFGAPYCGGCKRPAARAIALSRHALAMRIAHAAAL